MLFFGIGKDSFNGFLAFGIKIFVFRGVSGVIGQFFVVFPNMAKDSFMFEWTRLDEGESLLKHQIDQFGLSELEETGVYYDSIKWFENPEEEIGRQYYWEHDGYLFSMYIPNSEVSGTLSFEVEQILLDY